jgi:hypothetical protein
LENIREIAATVHSVHGKLYWGTMISRQNLSGCDTSWKDVLNPAIRRLKDQGVLDGYFNMAADPRFGADGAANATTGTACNGLPCYGSDKIHPTGLSDGTGGQPPLGQWWANFMLASIIGSTESNPDSIATTTYQMLPQNKYVLAAPTEEASWMLPDCIALDGLGDPKYTIVNTSTFAIALAGTNSETVSGSATIAAGSTARLLPVFEGDATGGCHWQRVY